MAELQVSGPDVRALATKLQELGSSLTPTQQALLAEILQSALSAMNPDEVRGYDLGEGTFDTQFYFNAVYYIVGRNRGDDG